MMSAAAAVLAWVLLAVNSWGASPAPAGERTEEVRQRAAESIFGVAYDADEPPLFQGNLGRARTALLLVSLGGEESRFQEHILSGRCKPSECDHGLATGMLQVHLGPHGLRFLGDKASQCNAKAIDCWTKDDLVNDWSLQPRTALHVYRTQGPMAFTKWQRASADAVKWYVQHPPPATDEMVMSGALIQE
jgi:hypothetical protein